MSGTHTEVITNQQALWDAQHARRGGQGLEGDLLVDTPNESGIFFGTLLNPNATIAEVGSANGRDARYWARQGHDVHCLDFSRVALGQLVAHAKRQGVDSRIHPIHFDANTGRLPDGIGDLDGFYARSALHVDDETLMSLLGDVTTHLKPRGVVLIEGKGTNDPKIARSHNLGNGLAVDPEEHGHLRRVWTPESLHKISGTLGWTALNTETSHKQWADTTATFLRFVATK